ncbi:MAG: tetratricopeptide repeat protein [Acidobacteria bacterium]|nr:tetratricopeptide repeat protein [Acidobacteriota bacterium]
MKKITDFISYLIYKREIAVSLLIIILVFSIYWSVLGYPFIDYDDPEYILDNLYIQQGINFESLKWAFTAYYASNWHPITWLSHMIDYKLYGLNASGHHLTNVLFHTVNSVLFFLAFYFLTKSNEDDFDEESRIFFSALVAIIFAIHPLRVESVAWVSERKDVLSGFFAACLLVIYSFYIRNSNLKLYLVLMIIFSLGLMAKPMLVTLPFVLLLMDFWPLKRFYNFKTNSFVNIKIAIKLILEKVPLLILSLTSSLITLSAQKAGYSVISLESLPLKTRLFNSIISYIGYLEKFFFPINLSVLYPYTGDKIALWKVLIAFIFLAMVSLLAIKFAAKYPSFIVGWLWYLGTLVPVIGLVQVGSQSMADRYSYIPLIGINIIVCYLLADLMRTYLARKQLIILSTTILSLILMILSIIQLDNWRDSETLCYQALKVDSNNSTMHFMLANQLIKKNDLFQAKKHLEKSIEISPTFARAYNSLGVVFGKEKDFSQAINYYKKALEYDPSLSETYCNLGILYSRLGDYPKAIESLKNAISFNPNLTKAYFYLSISYLNIKDRDSALEQYKILQTIAPTEAAKLLPILMPNKN